MEQRTPNAWTTYEDLTPDQRERYGDYVRAKDDAARAMRAHREAREQAQAALAATGGDKQAALALLLGEAPEVSAPSIGRKAA